MTDRWRLPTLTGQLSHDVPAFLRLNGCPATAVHVAQVAAEARRLAQRFDLDPERAAAGGWLHDCSAVIPNADRIATAVDFGLEVLPEEARLPMILHQKLSAAVGRSVFQVQDDEALRAVGCHTTLKAEPSAIDLLLFVADKLAWDQPGEGLPIHRHQYTDPSHQSFVASLVCFLQFFFKTLDCCPTKCYSIHGTPPLARLLDLLKDKAFLSFLGYLLSISFSVCL